MKRWVVCLLCQFWCPSIDGIRNEPLSPCKHQMIRQATPRNLLRFHCCAHHTHRGGFISIWIGGLVQGFFFSFSVVSAKCLQRRAGASCVSVWMKPVCSAHCVYCQKHFGVIGPIQCLWKCIEWNLDSIWSKQLHHFFSMDAIEQVRFSYKGCRGGRNSLLWKVSHTCCEEPGYINSCMDVR